MGQLTFGERVLSGLWRGGGRVGIDNGLLQAGGAGVRGRVSGGLLTGPRRSST